MMLTAKVGAVFALFAAALIATLTLLIIHTTGKRDKQTSSAGKITRLDEAFYGKNTQNMINNLRIS